MTRVLIGTDGMIRGLWSDAIDWHAIGYLNVERASHVEFCRRRQMWYVRLGRPRGIWRRTLRVLLRRPFGEILHWASSRRAALAWEQEYFGVSGLGWSRSGQ